MKKHIALGLVASTLILAGCCTSHHAVVWQYQTVDSIAEVNKLAADGWVAVGFAQYEHTDAATWLRQSFLMKRPKQ
jgi:hypothetical protein